MSNKDKKARAMKECAEWNRDHPIGTRVTVGFINKSFNSRTTSAAMVSNNMAVIWVEGDTAAYSLSTVKPVEQRS